MSEDKIKQQLLKSIPHVTSNFSQGSEKPLGLGGVARYYTVAEDTVALVQAVKAACDVDIPYRVLGMGESTLISDSGFDGLLIKNAAQSYAVSQEQSQVVVDSGMPMRKLVTIAANLELGGLIPLYGGGGTVGGALFHNSFHAHGSNQRFSDSLRSLTLLMPPTKIKPEPSIVRFKGTWLTARVEEGETKLSQYAQRDAGRMPVVLTAQLQLTSLRSDEIMRRFMQEVAAVEVREPSSGSASRYFGPLFLPLPGTSLAETFQASGVATLEVAGLRMSKKFPNYVMAAKHLFKKPELPVSTERLEQFCVEVAAAVERVFSTKLERAFSYIGTPLPEASADERTEAPHFE